MRSDKPMNFYIPAGGTITVLAKMDDGNERELTLTAARTMRLRMTPIVEEGDIEEHPGYWYAEPDKIVGFDIQMTGVAERLTVRAVTTPDE